MASLHSQYQVHNLPAGYKLSKANCKPAASKPGPKCQFVAETVFLDAAVNGDVAGKFPQQLGRTLQYFGLNGGEGEGTMNRCSSAYILGVGHLLHSNFLLDLLFVVFSRSAAAVIQLVSFAF